MEHFAIAPQLRGQSWGSRALREFLAEGDPVVLEIDPPEDPVSRRRKGFYEGLGLVSNPWPHIHPPYRLEFSGHALEVMTFPGGWDEGQYRRFARYLDETVMADRPQKVAGAEVVHPPGPGPAPVLSVVPDGSCGGRKSG